MRRARRGRGSPCAAPRSARRSAAASRSGSAPARRLRSSRCRHAARTRTPAPARATSRSSPRANPVAFEDKPRFVVCAMQMERAIGCSSELCRLSAHSAIVKSVPARVEPARGGMSKVTWMQQPVPGWSFLRLDVTLTFVHSRTCGENGFGCTAHRLDGQCVDTQTDILELSDDLRQLVDAAEERGSLLQSELNEVLEPLEPRRARGRPGLPRARDAPDRTVNELGEDGEANPQPQPVPQPLQTPGRRRPTRCSSSCARPGAIRS